MNTDDKKFRLTPDEAEYIKDLIVKNEYVIRAVVRSVLQERFDRIGEDCISEIYILACEKIEILKNHENPKGWIIIASKKVALNMARQYAKECGRISSKNMTDLDIKDHVFDDAVYNIWMEQGSIEKLLNTLTPRESQVYELIFKQQLSTKKTAEILGVTESTVRNIILHIRRKIKSGIKTKLF